MIIQFWCLSFWTICTQSRFLTGLAWASSPLGWGDPWSFGLLVILKIMKYEKSGIISCSLTSGDLGGTTSQRFISWRGGNTSLYEIVHIIQNSKIKICLKKKILFLLDHLDLFPLLVLLKALFSHRSACNSPSSLFAQPKRTVKLWAFRMLFCVPCSVHPQLNPYPKHNQNSFAHHASPLGLASDFLLGFLCQLCELTLAPALPYNGSLFVGVDLAGKQGYFWRNRYSLT